MRRAWAVFAIAAAMALPLGGQADDGTPAAAAGDPDACLTYVPALGMTCPRPDGHYEVVLDDGTRLLTHGPDPLPPPGDVGFDIGDEEREPVCAAEYTMHVLYAYPSTDRYEQVADDIRSAVRRINAVLNADALESGGVEADYRVMCDEENRIRVDAFKSTSSDFSDISNAARAAGFSSPTADYLIFYDGDETGVCGVGNIVYDDRLSADNGNMKGPHYGVTYKSCWFSRTPMHENGHNQGAVQLLAPDTDLSGHCLEGRDVMCYPTSQILVFCGDRTHFDCDFDTYFDAKPESGEWLASHWNIGSRLNKYISFSDTDPDPVRAGQKPEPEEPTEPEPTEPEPTEPGEPSEPEEPEEPEEPTEPEPTEPEPAPSTGIVADEAPQDAPSQDAPVGLVLLVGLGVALLARRPNV